MTLLLAAGEAEESEAALASVLMGGAARLVYKAALKALPGDLKLREGLLKAAQSVPLPAASALKESILGDLRADFRSDFPQLTWQRT